MTAPRASWLPSSSRRTGAPFGRGTSGGRTRLDEPRLRCHALRAADAPVRTVRRAGRRRELFHAGNTGRVAKTQTYTLAYDDGETSVDLCKIIFGGDGSYFVTAPYHPHDRALIAKFTVNYARDEQNFPLSEAVDVGLLEDAEQRLKLSHHPDGFLQFSGHGVLSGRDQAGKIRGIGVMSWPLYKPTLGPSFSVAFSSPVACGRQSEKGKIQERLVFYENDIEHMRPAGTAGLILTGYYFPMQWREFVVRWPDGSWRMPLIHPRAQAVKTLNVVLASKDCTFPGFIGLEAQPHRIDTSEETPGFFMSSSTGNLRRNEAGELLGEGLMCMYPDLAGEDRSFRSLNFPLNDPSYTAAPSSGV